MDMPPEAIHSATSYLLSAETPVLNKAIEGEAALRQGTLKANVRVAGRLSKQSHSVK